jgi:hypothetical protein
VLPKVRRGLDGVPLELHACILGRQDEPGKAWGNGGGALFEQSGPDHFRPPIPAGGDRYL